jgi:putative FmdB family regulatory protein
VKASTTKRTITTGSKGVASSRLLEGVALRLRWPQAGAATLRTAKGGQETGGRCLTVSHEHNYRKIVVMPTYNYKCLACGKKFSVHMSIRDHDRRRASCPKCGGKKLQQRVEGFFAITAKKS